MRLTEMDFAEATPIQGYGPGFIRVAGQIVATPVCVTAKGARAWGGYEDAESLMCLAGEIDVLFIGTGAQTAHVPGALRARLQEAGIGVEAMNSPAACRTFNVLLSEGRRVAAALLAV